MLQPVPTNSNPTSITPPEAPGEWSLAQIIEALSRPIPKGMLKDKKLTNKKTGAVTTVQFIAWHTAVKILNKYAPGWHWEIISTSVVGPSLVITGRLTVPTIDGNVYRDATGISKIEGTIYGDASSNAESMALRRAAAKYGLGLYLYNR